MIRVRELDFPYSAALYRGDGSGVAEISRHLPFDQGSCWARVDLGGAGVDSPYIYLERRSGGVVDGRTIVEDHVFAVDGDRDSAVPDRAYQHASLTSLGEIGEVADAAFAREADATGGEKMAQANARIAANTFIVTGEMRRRRWRVSVGPTINGKTSLECHGEDGDVIVMHTTTDRATLEAAQTRPVAVPALVWETRPILGGRRTREVEITLEPYSGTASE